MSRSPNPPPTFTPFSDGMVAAVDGVSSSLYQYDTEGVEAMVSRHVTQGTTIARAMKGLSIHGDLGGRDGEDAGGRNGGRYATMQTMSTTNHMKNKNQNKTKKRKNHEAKAPESATTRSQTLGSFLDGVSYPHIADNIIALLGRDAIPLRAISRTLCILVDRSLLKHVYLTRDGTVDARGRRFPRTDFECFPTIKGAPRVMTLVGDAFKPDAIDLSGLDVIRMPAVVRPWWRIETPTVVMFASVLPSLADHWLFPAMLPMPAAERFTPHVRRVVYNVEYSSPLLLFAAMTVWDAPLAHVRELVVRITQVRIVDDVPAFIIGTFDNGQLQLSLPPLTGPLPSMEDDADDAGNALFPVPDFVRDLRNEPTVFDMIAEVLARELRPNLHCTLVGLEALEWWTSTPSITINRIRKSMAQHHVRFAGVSLETARREVDSAVDFITQDEYRSTVGEATWQVETNIEFPGFEVPNPVPGLDS